MSESDIAAQGRTTMPAMNVSLTPELEAFVQEQVKSGAYVSASEVVREGLRLLVHENALSKLELERLRQQVQQGLDQLDRGEGIAADEAFAELRRRAAKRASENSKRA
jgi:antitoxin ParD1/3/4